jgi:hypothetical protein
MFLAVYISGGIAALLAYTGFWILFFAKSVKLVVSRTSIHIGTSTLIILSGNVLNEISRLGSYMTFAATIFALTYIADKERQES